MHDEHSPELERRERERMRFYRHVCKQQEAKINSYGGLVCVGRVIGCRSVQ